MQYRSSDSSKHSPIANDTKALNTAAAEDVNFSINAADRDDLEALQRAEQADQRQEE